MREIKFRAWHKKDKKMYLVDELFFGLKGEGIVEVWLGDEKRDRCIIASFDEVELMQFTGLKDKSGKEIYEGDIIEYIPFLSSGIAYRTEPERTTVVFKETTKFCGFYPFGLFNALLPHDVVVIGNIYENSKLLKETGK